MLPLTEKYKPRTIAEFVGLEKPKRIMADLARNPRPCSLLLVGPAGTGKTTMAFAFANQIGASVIHIPAQDCSVDRLRSVCDSLQYYPPSGEWWVVIVDESEMSKQAQMYLRSRLDSTANLAFDFGGAVRESKPTPVIFIFTANGVGSKETVPPSNFERPFLSRCRVIEFEAETIRKRLPAFLRKVWADEGGHGQPDFGNGARDWADDLARETEGSVRDALNKLEMMLMDCELSDGEQEYAKARELPASPEEFPPVRCSAALESPKPTKPVERNPYESLPLWDHRRLEWENRDKTAWLKI